MMEEQQKTRFYIITPAYNAAQYIDETIVSVVTQAGDFSIRYHVQDGGSSDGTLAILQKWHNDLKDNPAVLFSYASEQDGGMYDAINKAFAALDIPSNAFMGWINADDILFPGALSAVAEFAQNAAVDWVYGIPTNIDREGHLIGAFDSIFYPQALVAAGLADGTHWSFFQQEGSFFRKFLWDEVGGCDMRFRLAGDWDLWRRMAAICAPFKIAMILGAFRTRPGQLSANMTDYRDELEKNAPLQDRQKSMIAHSLSHPLSALQLESSGGLATIPFTFKMRVRSLMLALSLKRTVRFIQAILSRLRQLGR